MIFELTRLANELDSAGLLVYASKLDSYITVLAGHDEHEDYMSSQHIESIQSKTKELLPIVKVLAENGKMPDWLESKISAMSDDADEIYNYLIHSSAD